MRKKTKPVAAEQWNRKAYASYNTIVHQNDPRYPDRIKQKTKCPGLLCRVGERRPTVDKGKERFTKVANANSI
jgi:hypothetical protein